MLLSSRIAFASGVGGGAWGVSTSLCACGFRRPCTRGAGRGKVEVTPYNKFCHRVETTPPTLLLQRTLCLANHPLSTSNQLKNWHNFYLDEVFDAVRQTAVVMVQVVPASQRLPGGVRVDHDREAKAGLARARLGA